MNELVQVWPQNKIKKMSGRRPYVDSEGNVFSGTHREARQYYANLHPSKNIKLNILIKKRK